jgi:DNA recombination protein RmuC
MVDIATILLSVILVGTVLMIFLLWRIQNFLNKDQGVETDQLTSALSQSFENLNFNDKVTLIEEHAADIQKLHTDIERILRNPQQRGSFGEKHLGLLLDEHLPTDMYGTRESVVGNKTPDAYIKSAEGKICIDSKFPLDNYERYAEADDEDERKKYKKKFRGDVKNQLEKVASDYVQPEKGTAQFAFAFIPSESIYYHLVTEEDELLHTYTKEGVQIVSPLTLGHKIELIKAGVHAEKLSEQVDEVKSQLDELRGDFEDFEDDWGTLQRHVRNAKNKADEVDREYESLKTKFDRIDNLSSVESDN